MSKRLFTDISTFLTVCRVAPLLIEPIKIINQKSPLFFKLEAYSVQVNEDEKLVKGNQN